MSTNQDSVEAGGALAAMAGVGNAGAAEHAWRYLTLYSTQRLQLLRFYLFSAAVLTAGLSGCLLSRAPVAGVALGFGLSILFLTFIFWKLEQRTGIRVRQGEATIIEIERQFPRGASRPFGSERGTLHSLTKQPQGASGTWSYSRIARAAFAGGASVGLVGSLIAICRLTGWIN